MKQYLCLTLLACAPFSTTFSASTKTHQLPAQNIEVAPAHLTTRLNWSVFPKPLYANEDLKQRDSAAIIRVTANARGTISDASIDLRVKGNTPECDFNFDSKVWNAQSANKKTPFQYVSQPKLDLTSHELKQHDRKVKFNFKVNKHGQVKKVKIKQGSGIYALDQKVVEALRNSQISVKRTASTLWIYKKSNFKDEIQFKVNGCK